MRCGKSLIFELSVRRGCSRLTPGQTVAVMSLDAERTLAQMEDMNVTGMHWEIRKSMRYVPPVFMVDEDMDGNTRETWLERTPIRTKTVVGVKADDHCG